MFFNLRTWLREKVGHVSYILEQLKRVLSKSSQDQQLTSAANYCMTPTCVSSKTFRVDTSSSLDCEGKRRNQNDDTTHTRLEDGVPRLFDQVKKSGGGQSHEFR